MSSVFSTCFVLLLISGNMELLLPTAGKAGGKSIDGVVAVDIVVFVGVNKHVVVVVVVVDVVAVVVVTGMSLPFLNVFVPPGGGVLSTPPIWPP